MDRAAHWDKIYGNKQPTELSWYRAHLDTSLHLIGNAAPSRDARVVDIGGGESTLVDDLLARGYANLSVLDISATALAVARARLGAAADRVKWLCGDVTTCVLEPHTYDVWHDRATFHFLTAEPDRMAYARQVAQAVKPHGHVIVATFGPAGPTKCSGLDVVRYDPQRLHEHFANGFQLVQHLTEMHRTPAGVVQQFVYCHLVAGGSAPR